MTKKNGNGHAKHLADGSHQGNGRKRGVDLLFSPPETDIANLTRALSLLSSLERIVDDRQSMKHEDQETLRAVRAFLVEHGWRMPEDRPIWVDRVSKP